MGAPKAGTAGASRIKVSPTGRLSLPADLRRAVGLEHGGTVVVELEEGTIRLRTIDEVLARARTAAREIVGQEASVDDFLKFRRELWND